MVTQISERVETLNVLDTVAPLDSWKRAYERAKAEQIRVYRDASGWCTSSTTEPGRKHRVDLTCDCLAGEHGHVCKHCAAVISARLRVGVLARCQTCGRIGTVGAEVAVTLVWLFGDGWIETKRCVDEAACWSRQAEAHVRARR